MRALECVSRICCVLVAAIGAACTATIGTPNPELLQKMSARGEFGAAQSVRICGLLDAGITEATARRLIDEAWNDTEAGALGLTMALVSLNSWQREGADIETIFRNVRKLPIAPECDRMLAFLGPSDDFVSGLAGGVSLTHGFVLASPESTRRFPLTPAQVTRHEIYHLVGCGHSPTMDECYRRIALAKSKRGGANAFFPVFLYALDEDIERNCGVNSLIDDRGEANRIAQRWAGERERLASGQALPARQCEK